MFDNKIELFSFVATSAATIAIDTQVMCCVLSAEPYQALLLALMEKQILLHLEDAVKQGYDKIPIRTVDKDVVVLAVTSAQRLNTTELCIAFGAVKNFRYLPSHEMANALGPDRCDALPMFHAFTSCDTVSCFEAGANGLHGTCREPMTNSYQLSAPCLLPRNPYIIGWVHWND